LSLLPGRRLADNGDAGHGAVKVTMNGQQRITSIKISPEAMNPNKPGDLEKLILRQSVTLATKPRRWRPNS
jgi:DNA-binding protein YbaB